MKLKVEIINGIMLGFEIIPQYDAAFIDVFFFRFYFDWSGEEYIG